MLHRQFFGTAAVTVRLTRVTLLAGIALIGGGLSDRVIAASSCIVQPHQFNRLQIGMTATQIDTILGCRGVRVARGAVGQTPVTAAEWRGPGRRTYVRVVYVGSRAGQIGWIRDSWP